VRVSLTAPIEAIRGRNNRNWMDLLRLAFKHAPEEAAEIMAGKLPYRTNRIANMTIGSLFTVIMGLILFAPGRVPRLSGYTLYGLIEMGITVAIVRTAWKWRVSDAQGVS
jgi:hypothetical protein